MIWRPKPGQRVVVRYNRLARRFFPHHGREATVETVGDGPGPINAQVRFDDGIRVIVPRGNLFPGGGCGP
ncbi:MAG TPA: hypothetical protein VM219_08925 [Phycisphaerae bacterium]|nr:hypothetical protein [Phycisphaerae bacterium]HUX03010.1 hypothetical protein [Phycisphaerae bacterium]